MALLVHLLALCCALASWLPDCFDQRQLPVNMRHYHCMATNCLHRQADPTCSCMPATCTSLEHVPAIQLLCADMLRSVAWLCCQATTRLATTRRATTRMVSPSMRNC
jgi:hypothetical protein